MPEVMIPQFENIVLLPKKELQPLVAYEPTIWTPWMDRLQEVLPEGDALPMAPILFVPKRPFKEWNNSLGVKSSSARVIFHPDILIVMSGNIPREIDKFQEWLSRLIEEQIHVATFRLEGRTFGTGHTQYPYNSDNPKAHKENLTEMAGKLQEFNYPKMVFQRGNMRFDRVDAEILHSSNDDEQQIEGRYITEQLTHVITKIVTDFGQDLGLARICMHNLRSGTLDQGWDLYEKASRLGLTV